jgi:hypothetical protein
VKYEERQQLKALFTIACYKRYDSGDVFIKTADFLTMSHKIIDEFYKREADDEKKRSNENYKG